MTGRFLRNVLIKGLSLFILIDLLFVAISPNWLGELSLYNHVFQGRLRFPFGEDSSQSYNLSLFNLDAMFASHIIAGENKSANEFRVIIIGDSSIWGTLLHPDQTLAGQLDSAALKVCGKKVRVYNLGYPTISLTKDLMVLDYAMRYKPDMIIWPLTLEAFPLDKQLTSPIVSNNAARVDSLIYRYNLPFSPQDPALVRSNYWDKTLIGQRRPIADLLRLQLYGVLWSATGIDQIYPQDYQHAQTDLDTTDSFHNMVPPTLDQSQLSFDVIDAGLQVAGSTPVWIINEPMLISTGKNSDIRYNFYYPRWAYDQWRQLMDTRAVELGWNYLDLWDLVPADQFTNSAIHMTPEGVAILSERLQQKIFISEPNCQ